MDSMSVFWCLITTFFLTYVRTVQIETPQGYIIGSTKNSFKGREFKEFLGIPYGKPPTGELRFKNPMPYGSWKGIKNATEDGSLCLQYEILGGVETIQVLGSEDCLYLNVYTPSVTKQRNYPVMVFIHGGGFALGGGTSSSYEPEYILDKDVVLVVMNYRLGALGFASTEDSYMSGNWGLKDQTLALKWVQENIAAYGGNPESVTIFGQSAGGACVHYHLMSPLSKGLFHQAIVMSGTAHCPWSNKWSGEIAKRTKMLASLLDCPTSSSTLLVQCLRKIAPEQFIQVNSHLTEIYGFAMGIFAPVVEPDASSSFLTGNPLEIRTSLPIMIGTTKDEGAFVVSLFQIETTLEDRLLELDRNFLQYGSVTLRFDNEGHDKREMMEEIRKFYFGEKIINSEVLQNVIDMYTDAQYFQCTTSAVRKHDGLAYMYLFTYNGRKSISNFLLGKNDVDYGVGHCDDLFFLFPLKNWDSQTNMTEDDLRMLDKMVSLWTNFAIYGNPTPGGSQIIWEKVTGSSMNYLDINISNMTMYKNLHPERDYFWQQLLQKEPSLVKNIRNEL